MREGGIECSIDQGGRKQQKYLGARYFCKKIWANKNIHFDFDPMHTCLVLILVSNCEIYQGSVAERSKALV